MITVRPEITTRNLQAAFGTAKRGVPVSTFAFVQSVAGAAMRDMLAALPRDTNRLANSWAQGASLARLGTFERYALRPSRFANRAEAILEAQVERAQMRVRWMESRGLDRYRSRGKNGAPTPRYLAALKLVERCKRELELFKGGAKNSAISTAPGEGWGTAVVMFNKNRFAMKTFASVRPKVYGGRGAMVQRDGVVTVTIDSLEPHARIIERRTRLAALTAVRMRTIGVNASVSGVTGRIARAVAMVG